MQVEGQHGLSLLRPMATGARVSNTYPTCRLLLDSLLKGRLIQDGIMIHSRRPEPDEIFEFVEKFRAQDSVTPLVVVPTSFNQVTEEEFKARGVNLVIYANQLTRTGFPAMQNAARTILEHHRAKECDAMCMPFKEIINLIPEEE